MRDTAIIRRERSARTGPDGIEFKLNRIYLRIIVSLLLFSLTTRISFAVLAIFGTFPISHLRYTITGIFSRCYLPRNKSFAKSCSWHNLATLPTYNAQTHTRAMRPLKFSQLSLNIRISLRNIARTGSRNCVALRRNALRVI